VIFGGIYPYQKQWILDNVIIPSGYDMSLPIPKPRHIYQPVLMYLPKTDTPEPACVGMLKL